MDGNIYEKLMRKIDDRFSADKSKVLLIVENCTAHVEVTGFQAIRVKYFTPITTLLSRDH